MRTRENLLVAIVATLFSASIANSQAPQEIPYQASARNSNGVILANKLVALQFTVHDASATGTTVYQETQTAVTNAMGLFVVNIGQGTPVSGTFSSINWGSNAKFMQVGLDTSGSGCCYVTIGTQQLMSVPYSMYSNMAGNGVPTGTIEAFAGPVANIPPGWELCAGQAVGISDATYANLFKAIGYSWGNPGNGQFNLPYTAGLFLRGGNNGNCCWDVDNGQRTAIKSGGNTGDNVGSVQYSQFESHYHYGFISVGSTPTNSTASSTTLSPTIVGYGDPQTEFDYIIHPDPSGIPNRANVYPGSSAGGSETRPSNVYVNYMIKL